MSQTEPEGFDPRGRRLCPDGACVGVIGAEGRCKVCGATDKPGAAAGLSLVDLPDEPEAEDVLSVGRDAAADGDAGFDPGRPLCPDGACVGVLGPDGRCKVCGRGAER